MTVLITAVFPSANANISTGEALKYSQGEGGEEVAGGKGINLSLALF